MIDSTSLSQLLLEAFSGKITWMAASAHYPVEEFIETFKYTRGVMIKTISDLTDEQVAYQVQGDPTWSLSEMVTHLIYSQNAYYNALLDITSSTLPHITEAAKGFGEGAKLSVPVVTLQKNIGEATPLIMDAIERTRANFDPNAVTSHPVFGKCNYATWILLMLGHEVDHVRQGMIMRRAARRALPKVSPVADSSLTAQ